MGKIKEPELSKEKFQSLKSAIEQIEKSYGKGSIMRLGDHQIRQMESISTGSISLDYALGIGGVPKGRVIEIFGNEGCGKTTMCLHIISESQKLGGVCSFVDTEHALDVPYAKKLGVDVDNLLVSQPEYGEQALDIVESLIRSNSLDVVVIDSVANLTPKAEIEGDMGDSHMGLQARLMSQALRKLTSVVSKSNTLLIFTNQMREKIGVMWGNPEVTTGGKALKFYSSIRLEVKKLAQIKDGTKIIGNRTKVKVVKNKVAPPFKETEFDIIYGEGISKIGDLIDTAINHNVIEKSGAWFSYKQQRVQGRDGVKQLILEDKKLFDSLDTEVRNILGLS